METKNIDPRRLCKVIHLACEHMPNHLYHNIDHAKDVCNVATELAKAEGINKYDIEILQTASWLHDVILVPRQKDNEERSAKFAEAYLPKLPKFRYNSKEISEISNLILSTKYPTNPMGKLQEIICDADVANVGRDDFFEKGYLVFRELGIPKEKWAEMQKGFLNSHQFYTDSAKRIYGAGKERNIQLLEGGIK